MYEQDKVEKELFLDTILIFQCSKDSSLQNITHKQGEMCFFLLNSLKVFENGMLEEGNESSIYRWILKGWFTNLLLQIQLRLAYQPYLPNSIKVGSPTFSSNFNQGWLTNLFFQRLMLSFLVFSKKTTCHLHPTAILLPFSETTCHFDWCCHFLCSQRKWHVVCIILSFSETTRRFSTANAECCWCLVGPTFNL